LCSRTLSLLLVLSALCGAGEVSAKVFHSRSEALELAFPEADRVEDQTYVLRDDQVDAIEALDEGAFFESSTDRGVIIGAKLAENLDARLGRKVVYTMTDKQGEIVQAAVRVTGIVRTGAPSVDSGLCLLPIDHLRHQAADVGDAVDAGAQIVDGADGVDIRPGPRRGVSFRRCHPAFFCGGLVPKQCSRPGNRRARTSSA